MKRHYALLLLTSLAPAAFANPKIEGREAPKCEAVLDDAERLAFAESQLLRSFARLKSGRSLALGVDELRYFETLRELGGESQAKVLRAMAEAKHDVTNNPVLTPEEKKIFLEVADRLEGRTYIQAMQKGFEQISPANAAAEREWNSLEDEARKNWEGLIHAWNYHGQLKNKDLVLVHDSNPDLRRAIYLRLQHPMARVEMLRMDSSVAPHPMAEMRLQLAAHTRAEERDSKRVVEDMLLLMQMHQTQPLPERVRFFTDMVRNLLLTRRNPIQHLATLLEGMRAQNELTLALFVIQSLDHKGMRVDEAVAQSGLIAPALEGARRLLQQEPTLEIFKNYAQLDSALFVIARFGGQQSDLLLVREAEQRWLHLAEKQGVGSEAMAQSLKLIFPPVIRWLSQRVKFPHEMEAKFQKPSAPRHQNKQLGSFDFLITVPEKQYVSTTYPAEAMPELLLQRALQRLAHSYMGYEDQALNTKRQILEVKVLDPQTLLTMPIMSGQSPWPKNVVNTERELFKGHLEKKDAIVVLVDWKSSQGFGQSAILFDRHKQNAWVLSLALQP